MPGEIRNLIYDEIKEIDGIGHFRYDTLQNLSMTCKTARAEVFGYLYFHRKTNIRLVWYIGHNTPPEILPYRHKHHGVVGSWGERPHFWENPLSPIVLHRKYPELSGFSVPERCTLEIKMVRGRNYYRRSIAEFLDNTFAANLTIMSKILSEISSLSPCLKQLEICFAERCTISSPWDWMNRLIKEALVDIAQEPVNSEGNPGRIEYFISGHRWDLSTREETMESMRVKEAALETVEEILARPAERKRKAEIPRRARARARVQLIKSEEDDSEEAESKR